MEATMEMTGQHTETADLMLGDRADAQVHGRATARIAIRAALGLGLSATAAGRVGLAAVLHDVGKRLISPEILYKPGRLDDDEWAQIRLHPVLGEQILLGRGLNDIAPWVRSHHERVDGLGYPDGLAGGLIPIEARLLACADAYDAMTSDRCYRPALSPEQAREELIQNAGTQFDPKVLAVVLRCTHDEVDALGTEAAQHTPPRFD